MTTTRCPRCPDLRFAVSDTTDEAKLFAGLHEELHHGGHPVTDTFACDAWGRPLMQPGDGHSAWGCNNYDCPDHPNEMYPSFANLAREHYAKG